MRGAELSAGSMIGQIVLLRFWGKGPKRKTVVWEETKDLLGRGEKGRSRQSKSGGRRGGILVWGEKGGWWLRGRQGVTGELERATTGNGWWWMRGRLAWAGADMESSGKTGWLEAGGDLAKQTMVVGSDPKGATRKG